MMCRIAVSFLLPAHVLYLLARYELVLRCLRPRDEEASLRQMTTGSEIPPPSPPTAASCPPQPEVESESVREHPAIRLRNLDACDAMSTERRWRLLLRRLVCCDGKDTNTPSSEAAAASSGHRQQEEDVESRLSPSQIRAARQYDLTHQSGGLVDKGQPMNLPQNPSCCRACLAVPVRWATQCLYQILCCGSARHPNASLTQKRGSGSTSRMSRSSSATTVGQSTDPNRLVSRFLDFTFRSSFVVVVVMAATGYYALVCLFAAMLVGAARHDPSCVTIGGTAGFPSANGTGFADAFSLSWTTLCVLLPLHRVNCVFAFPFHCKDVSHILNPP